MIFELKKSKITNIEKLIQTTRNVGLWSRITDKVVLITLSVLFLRPRDGDRCKTLSTESIAGSNGRPKTDIMMKIISQVLRL